MSGAYLNEIPIAAVGHVAWALTSGTAPFQTRFTFHRSQWDSVNALLGQPCRLKLVGLNGQIDVQHVYPLHETETNSPNRRAVVVADRRWKWPYSLHVKDYNVVRSTGDRVMLRANEEVPVELAEFRDRFQYLEYSLDEGNRWTARRVLEDVLEAIEPGNWAIRDLPVEDSGEDGTTSIQNLLLRDSYQNAIGRVAQGIPGLGIFVDYTGKVIAFDGADLEAAESRLEGLGPIMQSGNYPRKIDRRAVRPSKVRVYFVKEVECRFDYQEGGGDPDYANQGQEPSKSSPFIDNVLPLPAPTTDDVKVLQTDGTSVVTTGVQGTYVSVSEALRVWERDRQAGDGGAMPWSFDTLRWHWFRGGLMNVLAPSPALDQMEDGTATSQVQALQSHFRQTFRINPRYMTRIRDIKAQRVALLDPITGTRSPAMVWGQYAILPTVKATRRIVEGKDDVGNVYNVDSYPGYENALSDKPSPHANVRIVDPKLGVFHVSYTPGPYGLQGAFVPSNILDSTTGSIASCRRGLRYQDDHPIAMGAKVDAVAGILLASEYEMATILTITMNTPNGKGQLHVEEIEAKDVGKKFRKAYGIEDGDGPVLEIFVPPSTCTARFGWFSVDQARPVIERMMSGEDVDYMDGYIFVNGDDEIKSVATAAAAEAIINYADAVAGQPMTAPDETVPTGGIDAISHAVEAGGRVATTHAFRGRQIHVDKYAMLPPAVRHLTLGIIPYGGPLK